MRRLRALHAIPFTVAGIGAAFLGLRVAAGAAGAQDIVPLEQVERPRAHVVASAAIAGAQDTAVLVAPGVLSTDGGEGWLTFDPSGEVAVFGRHENAGWNRHTIWVARRTASGWSAPVVAPFSGTYEDRGARFSPDGRRLIFSSMRPRPGATEARRDFDLWIVERRGDGWSEPALLPPPVSSEGNDFHASIASDGTIWFASSREGGAGRSDIYMARSSSGGTRVVERLGPPINTERSEPDVFIDPAQRYMILARTDDPSGLGGDDLFISTRTAAGGWSAPRNLGRGVNTTEYEYGPLISADGRTLYFTSHRGGNASLYRIPTAAVGIPGNE